MRTTNIPGFPGASLVLVLLGALLCFPPAVSTQSREAERLIREAEQALRNEDFRAAERLYRAAGAADAQNPEASCGLGQVFLALQRYEEAVGALERCKRDVLGNLRELQAEQARQWGAIDQEIREIEESLQAIRSGRVRSAGPDRELRLEERIRELQQFRARDPVRVEVPTTVSFALGTAYLNAGLPEKAEWELIAVLRQDQGSGDTHNNLAAVYLALGRFEEAADHVRRAEELGVRVNPQMKADISARYSPGAVSASRKAPGPGQGPGEEITLSHEARTCAVRGRFVHVKATVTPSWGVHDPILYFRTGEEGGWHSTYMLPAGQNDFATVLPKARSAESFTYYVEVKTYEDEVQRTPDQRVEIVGDTTACTEDAQDADEPGSVIIVDKPKDVANAPPVPKGLSIRGTTADAGALEVGSNKALVYGGIGLLGAIGAGVAVAVSQSGVEYGGPQPFSEAPGIRLVATEPPSGSTLSLSGGQITVRLDVFSVESLPGAQITAEIVPFDWGPTCIQLTTSLDLPAGQTRQVTLTGPTTPSGTGCSLGGTLESIMVRVTNPSGTGGFRTGVPPRNHLRVMFNLAE